MTRPDRTTPASPISRALLGARLRPGPRLARLAVRIDADADDQAAWGEAVDLIDDLADADNLAGIAVLQDALQRAYRHGGLGALRTLRRLVEDAFTRVPVGAREDGSTLEARLYAVPVSLKARRLPASLPDAATDALTRTFHETGVVREQASVVLAGWLCDPRDLDEFGWIEAEELASELAQAELDADDRPELPARAVEFDDETHAVRLAVLAVVDVEQAMPRLDLVRDAADGQWQQAFAEALRRALGCDARVAELPMPFFEAMRAGAVAQRTIDLATTVRTLRDMFPDTELRVRLSLGESGGSDATILRLGMDDAANGQRLATHDFLVPVAEHPHEALQWLGDELAELGLESSDDDD